MAAYEHTPMTRLYSFAVALILLTLSSACAQPRLSGGDDGSIYSTSVQPILDAKCASCHDGSDQAPAHLGLNSWANVLAGSRFGEAVIPFDAGNSVLVEIVEKLQGVPHPTTPGTAALSQSEVGRIKDWINSGAASPDGIIAGANSQDLVYVANQADASVYVIDAHSNNVVRTIDLQKLGYSANAKPHHIAVEKDGSFWYVSMIVENRVLKFNRQNELVGSVEFQVPGLLTLDPDSDRLFVGRSMAAVNPPQSIGMISRSDMSLEEISVFHPRPHAIILDPEGEYVYSGSLGENRLMVVDVSTGDGTVHLLDGPTHTLVQFAITPDRKTMIVGGQLTGKLFFFDASNPPELPIKKIIDVNAAPWHPSISADSEMAYFGNKMANSVTVVNMQSMSVVDIIEGNGLSQPHGSALSRNGRFLYITGNNLKGAYTPRHDFGDNEKPGTVVVIDTESHEIVKVLEVGAHAAGVATRPVE